MTQITIRQLAEICGVAVSTVSRAMNDRSDINPETRRRILTAAADHGYVPNTSARSLKITSTNTIAVIIQGETSPLLLQILHLLEPALADHGYGLVLTHVAEGSAHAQVVSRIVTERKFDGVIFLGRYGDQTGDHSRLGESLAQVGVPMVFCTTADFSGSAWQHSSVSVDDRIGSYELTRYLIELGHTRIACVGNGLRGDGQHVWALRVAGYQQALVDAGIQPDPGLLLPAALPSNIYSITNGYESMRERMDRGPADFSAVVCICDAVAVGVMRALAESGVRVPEDCSVTGFDDLELARFVTPPLTTLAQPLEDIVSTTARAMVLALENPSAVPEQIWLRGRLVTRESTAARVASLSQPRTD